MTRPEPTARRLPAQRMPAEWEPHAATWLAWPHNPETWPGHLEAAEDEFEMLVRAIARFEPVRVLVLDDAHRHRVQTRLAGAGPCDVVLHVVATDDAWLRDTGPTFALAGGELVAIDWIFNAWGGKYAPWDRDAAVARQIAALAGAVHQPSELTLEGGALEVDGEGTLLATRSCLLDPDRNPGCTQAQIEAELGARLGVERVLWVDAELGGDDTDGHIDNLARFVAPARVVCARAEDASHPDHASLERLRATLLACHDARGRPLEVLPIPLPSLLEGDAGPLPASHVNFLIVNRGLIVPTFGGASDEVALDRLRKCFPERSVVGVSCRTLVRGFGGPHCLSQQQPRTQEASTPAAAAD